MWCRQQPGPGQIVASFAAAGANFPDILITQGEYQFEPKLPFALCGQARLSPNSGSCPRNRM